MKATGGIINPARMLAYALLRHMPKTRQAARRIYWSHQKKAYAKLAATEQTQPHTVLFEAYGGRSYACSPKAVFQALVADDRFADWEFIWSFKVGCAPDLDSAPELARARMVIRGSEAYFRLLAQAATLVVNNRVPEYVDIKPDQTYIQCWHGTPLKRLGYDVPHMEGALNTAAELAGRFGVDAAKWTYLLSPSPFASQHLADAFGVPQTRRPEVLLEVGYPRNDVLAKARLGNDHQMAASVRHRLGIPEERKVLLYAPTWRDDSYKAGVGYTFDYLLDFAALQKALGDTWIVLFRPHYYISNSFDFDAYKDFVIDVSAEADINDLYVAADALVTDYSSVMFDYANLRRPMMLFVPDIQHYEEDIRGFYFDIHEVPGPLCTTTEQLVREILDIPYTYEQRYSEAYDTFVERFCPLDDGHATERFIQRVFDGI